MPRTSAHYIDKAAAAFDAGFPSKAAQKAALADLNRAFDLMTNAFRDAILTEANGRWDDHCAERSAYIDGAGYWDFPSYPHHWRAKHADALRGTFGDRFAGELATIDQVVELRNAIKAVEIEPVPVNENKARVETVRRSLLEMMEARRAQYVEALEVGRLFGGLPVTVNAHLVNGHKGTVFVRHFFYLRGELTPLQVIIAAAETLARETA